MEERRTAVSDRPEPGSAPVSAPEGTRVPQDADMSDGMDAPEGTGLDPEAVEALENPIAALDGFFDLDPADAEKFARDGQGRPFSASSAEGQGAEGAAAGADEPSAASEVPVPEHSAGTAALIPGPAADAQPLAPGPATPEPAAPKRTRPKGLRIGIAGAPYRQPAKKRAATGKAQAAGKAPAAAVRPSSTQPKAAAAIGKGTPMRPGAAGAKPVHGAPEGAVARKASAPAGPAARVGEEESEDKAKARKGALFMTVILAVYFGWMLVSGQMGDFVGALKNASWPWLLGAVACMGLRLVFGSLAYVFAAYIDPASPVGVRDCVSVESTGVLFGNLTPMNSGAIPAQIYRLTKTGLDVGQSGAYQFTRFIMYQAGEVIVGAVLLLLRFDFFLQNYGDLVFLNIVVFTIQTLQAAGLLMVCLMPRFVMRVGNWGLRLARRHKWLKKEKVDEYSELVNGQVMEFAQIFRDSIRHTQSMVLSWIVTVGMMVCFYSVPWFVLRALGGDADYLTCLAAGSMVQMIGNSVPLPGGTGGNEAGFAFFFGPIFGAQAMSGFVIWRIVTFFLPTLAALPLTALRSSHQRSIYARWHLLRRGGDGVTVAAGRSRGPSGQKGALGQKGARGSAAMPLGKVRRRGGRKETVFVLRKADRDVPRKADRDG